MTPTLVLLAAGMSTRYGRMKQLEAVGPSGEALLDYAVFDARRAGFSRVLLIIREELEERFRSHIQGRWPADLEVVFHHQAIEDLPGIETDSPEASALALKSGAAETTSASVSSLLEGRTKPWGTGHALLTARDHLPGPFVLLNADDFYGAEAFHQASDLLRSGDLLSWGAEAGAERKAGATFGLVTYTLAETLSDHGGVSRGICEVDGDGWLVGVREVLEIQRGEEGISGKALAGQKGPLSGSEPVSTNFWIFTPAVFTLLERAFAEFFSGQVENASAGAEFLIPTVVNGALEAGVIRVRAVPTKGRFLGITHPQDRPWVVGGLEGMAEEGRYPSPLWG